jgi:uncharacterized membrane protein HdeD (DUF308 family)
MEFHAIGEDGRQWMYGSVLISIFLIIAGLLAIFLPQAAGIAINLMVGWMLILGGAAHWAFAWTRRGSGGLGWGLVMGLLYLITGAFLLVFPLIGLASLTFALAVYLLMEAALEFVLAFKLRGLAASGLLTFNGVITLILGVMILAAWPWSSLWAIGTLVGISILFSGIARLGLSLAARRHMFRVA